MAEDYARQEREHARFADGTCKDEQARDSASGISPGRPRGSAGESGPPRKLCPSVCSSGAVGYLRAGEALTIRNLVRGTRVRWFYGEKREVRLRHAVEHQHEAA